MRSSAGRGLTKFMGSSTLFGTHLSRYPRLFIRPAIGLLLGAGGLAWAWRGLEWPVVGHNLALISPAWTALAVAGVLAVAVIKAARWRILYGQTEARLSLWQSFSVLMAAQMVNLVIPIRLGELIRISLAKRYGCPATLTIMTLVVEKLADLAAAGLIATSLAGLALAPIWLRQPAGRLVLMTLALTAAFCLAWRLQRRLIFGRTWPASWLFPEGLGPLFQGRVLAGAIAWTAAIWLLSWLTVLALFAAFKLELSLAAAIVLMLAISASNIAPSPPALVGVIHGIAVVVLGHYGVPQPAAFSFGLVLNLVLVAPLIVLGSVSLFWQSVPLLDGFRRDLLHRSMAGQL